MTNNISIIRISGLIFSSAPTNWLKFSGSVKIIRLFIRWNTRNTQTIKPVMATNNFLPIVDLKETRNRALLAFKTIN